MVVKKMGSSSSVGFRGCMDRSAAAFAAYDDSQEELQTVTDYYNKLAHADYTTENILRVFGITKTNSKKIILL